MAVSATILGIAACAPPSVQPSNLIKIGNWNIEHLGKRKHGQSAKALAQHFFLAGPDVLVLEEIYDTDHNPTTRTNGQLDQAFRFLNKEPGYTWTYRLLPKRDPTDTRQLLGVAWNSEKVELKESWKIPFTYTDHRVFRRTPYAFFFATGNGRTDFIVVPLHLKSSFGGAIEGAAIRALEGEALARAIPEIWEHFGNERDIILAGDLNCVSHGEEALMSLADRGFRDLNRRDAITYTKGPYASPLDRILVPGEEPEFRTSRLYVLAPSDSKGHLDRLSDHFVVMSVFRILDDDD